ncbi:MAG: YHS domain protein [Rubrivivax sp.]|nr:YHS domain protein [Pyrinomonadaceae bacterium]
MKKTVPFVVIVIAIATAVGFFSMRRTGGVAPVNKDKTQLALRGYDPVAYFREGAAVEGRQEFESAWNGAKWRFKSAENRDEFARVPEAFAPQYGGYCSYAVGNGYTADGDPQAWKIVGGKLYVNYNTDVREMWEKDIAGLISKGDENWARFQKSEPEFKGERADERRK